MVWLRIIRLTVMRMMILSIMQKYKMIMICNLQALTKVGDTLTAKDEILQQDFGMYLSEIYFLNNQVP
jgi:hypothetical protein